jgi:hypothetical protein
VVIVAGADARYGLLLHRLRLPDGTELPATEYFRAMGGYLTAPPCVIFGSSGPANRIRNRDQSPARSASC